MPSTSWSGVTDLGQHSAPINRDATPTAKVSVGALSAALITVLISVADSVGITLEPDVAAALATIVYFGAAYWKQSRPGDVDY